MDIFQTKDIRNVSLIGGSKTGKTTLVETMLLNGGIINRRGSVDDKNTASDYKEIELDRQASVYASILHTIHNGKKINVIDTPGFDEFIGEVCGPLAVTEAAILIVNGQNSMEVGTEVHFRNASNSNSPLAFFINQVEHEKTNFNDVVQNLKNFFGPKVSLLQIPVNPGPGFNAFVDLLSMKMYQFKNDSGESQELDIPANMMDQVEELRAALIETAAESDEKLMEIFFEEGTLSEEQLINGLKASFKTRSIFPVLCGSGKQNVGISNLLQFIIDVVPSPDEASLLTQDGKQLEVNSASGASFFVFKSSVEPHLGEVSYFKMLGGKLTEGADVINARNDAKERVSQLFVMAGKNRTKVTEVMAGDISATIKLKDTKMGDTLAIKGMSINVDPIKYPEPKFRVAVKAKASTDDEKLTEVLLGMAKEDPTLHVGYSKELRQLIMQGQGELHLNIIKWYLDNQFKIEANYLSPKIPYRETITKAAKAMYRHRKQSGGSGQFGEVHIQIEPYEKDKPYISDMPVRGNEIHEMKWGGSLEFVNCIVGGSIDARFLPAVLKGLMERMERGPLTGSYARDIRVYLYDGKMHPVDSNEISFKLAGRHAFSEAFKNAGPKILEPVYDVEVIVPEESMGDVMKDLQGRRAMIMGMEGEGVYQRLKARVPLAEMNRFSTALSSISSGRGQYNMKYAEYQQVPSDVQDALLKAYEEEQANEE